MKFIYQPQGLAVLAMCLLTLLTGCKKDLPFHSKDGDLIAAGLRENAAMSISYEKRSQQTNELLSGPVQDNPYWDPDGTYPVYTAEEVDMQVFPDCSFLFETREQDPLTCSNSVAPALPFAQSKGRRTVVSPDHLLIYNETGSLILDQSISLPPVCLDDLRLTDGSGVQSGVLPLVDWLAGSLTPQQVSDYTQTIVAAGGTVNILADSVLGIHIPEGTTIGDGTPAAYNTHLLIDPHIGRPLGSTLYDQSGNILFQRFIRWSSTSPAVIESTIERQFTYFPNGTQTVTQTVSDYENVQVITQ